VIKVCPICHHKNAEDASMCENCGTHFSALHTVQITGVEGHGSRETDTQPLPVQGKIAFYAPDNADPIIIDIAEELTLGRHVKGGPYPLVDLTPFGAGSKGLSRVHAVIIPREDRLTLEDLNSTNGTWLNNRKLSPHQPTPLTDGDHIKMGQLTFQVRFAGYN